MEQEEPTMEEILASIRQILSSEENTPSVPVSKEEPIILDETEAPLNVPPPPAYEEEVKEVEAPTVIANPAPDAQTQHVDVQPAYEGMITLTPEMLVIPEEPLEDAIISQEVQDYPIEEPTQTLQTTSSPTPAVVPEPQKSENIPSANQDALTNLVAQLLKPALKEWMNDHMSEVLDRLVQDEIQKKS